MRTISRDAVKLGHGCPVRVHPFSNHGGYPAHDHEFHEICLITRGRAEHDSLDGGRMLRKGSVVVTAPGQVHGFARPRGLCGVNVYYLAPWLLSEPMVIHERRLVLLFLGAALFPGKEWRAAVTFELSSHACARAQALLQEISAEYEAAGPSLFAIKLLFLKFLHELSREAGEPRGGTLMHSRPEVWGTIRRIEHCVQENRRFSVAELERAAGCSAGHLHRLFHESTGSSPMAYYQRRRMQHAANLILNPRYSLTEVAYLVGCADSAHFSRCFRRQMKISPREYRRKHPYS